MSSRSSRENGYLLIDSKDRGSQPINDFLISKAGNNFPVDNIASLACNYVNFEWDIPNVTPRNNQFFLDDGSNTLIGTIPEGSYSPVDLLAAFNAELAVVAAAMTPPPASLVAVLDPSGVYTVTSASTPFQFVVDPNVDRDIATMFGFNTSGAGPLAAVQIGAVPALYYTRYVEIRSSSLHEFHSLDDQSSNSQARNVLMRVYNDQSPEVKHVITREPRHLKWIDSLRGVSFNSIAMELRDEYGKLLYNNYAPGDPTFNYAVEMITSSNN